MNQPSAAQLFNNAWESIDASSFLLNLAGIDSPMRNTSAFQFPLRRGGVLKACDEFNRRALLIGTNFGPIAVFERFANQGHSGSYGVNVPNSMLISFLVNQHQDVSAFDMLRIVGHQGILIDNIGHTIDALVRECNYYQSF